jgi:hypothetical protein
MKPTDSKLDKTYEQGKVLPAELLSWFLIEVLARDGLDHKSCSPHLQTESFHPHQLAEPC